MNRGLSYIGMAISLIAFLFTLPFLFKDFSTIPGMSGLYFYLNLTVTTSMAYSFIALGIILIVISFLPLFYNKIKSSSFDRMNNTYYFSALSVYIAILVFSSVLIEIFDPSIAVSPVSAMPLGKQNFIYMMGSVFQVLIFELVPLSILIIVFLAMSKQLRVSSFLEPYHHVKRFTVLFMLIAAAVAVLITNYNIYNSILIYISTLALSFIYIRYGFLRSMLASFVSSYVDFTLTAFSGNAVITSVTSVFLFIWAFAGLYSFTFYMVQRQRRENENRNNENKNNEEPTEHEKKTTPEPKVPANELWIRSACPNCGNVEYKINDDMSLECTKCGQKLDSDYIGPYNIIISNVLGRRQP
jgi:hypothetical protein